MTNYMKKKCYLHLDLGVLIILMFYKFAEIYLIIIIV